MHAGGQAIPVQTKTTTRSIVIRSTHTTEHVRIVYRPPTYQCCSNQGPFVTSEETIGIWDNSGVGNIAFSPLGQCGGCGQTISPYAVIADEERENFGVAGMVVRRDSGDTRLRWVRNSDRRHGHARWLHRVSRLLERFLRTWRTRRLVRPRLRWDAKYASPKHGLSRMDMLPAC